MEIYVLKEGQRRGPFLPFKLRELLEDKEFLPTDPGWIEGMEAWAPLSSIEALTNWMPRDPALPPPLPDPEVLNQRQTAATAEAAAVQDIEARRVRAWLRWLARTVDEMMWFTLIWLTAVSAGWLGLWDFLWRHPVMLFGPAVAWIPVEAFLISRFTTTPGKWLLGIRVTDDLGQPLSYLAALKRSAIVLAIGNGLGLPTLMLLPLLQAGMSWVLYQRSGSTLWDRVAGSSLVHERPTPLGFAGLGVVAAIWFGIGMWIALTAPIPPDAPADQRGPIDEMRQQIQQNWQQLKAGPKDKPAPIS
jgi:uncharacterized RDD family membrane protein YckC